ncbi:hypothetical protein [Roseibium album]|uniref:hypothetical protein n=1 Tax=Roseibium album TaxID=311410 RepID=UPI0024908424|nr:hypothetical protein [Roseibium album]
MKLEDRDKPLFYVGLTIVALLLVVVLWRQPLFARPWVDPACGEHSLECLFYTWQTLITGILAISGVYLTMSQMRREAKYARYSEFCVKMQDYVMCKDLLFIFDELESEAKEKIPFLQASEDRNVVKQNCPRMHINPETAPRKEFSVFFFDLFTSAAKDSADYQNEIEARSKKGDLRASYALMRANNFLNTIDLLKATAEEHIIFGNEEIRRWNSAYPEYPISIEVSSKTIENTKP